MAVETFDITTSEVADFLGHTGGIDANSAPTATQVTAWITQRSAEIGAALRGVGITPSNVDATNANDLYELIRLKVTSRVACDWLLSNQRELTDYTQQLVDEWSEYLSAVRTMPDHKLAEQTASTNIVESFTDNHVRTRWRKGTSFR